MDHETRYTLCSILAYLQIISRQAAEAQATATAVQLALNASPMLAEAFNKYDHSEQVTEIRLQAERLQVGIRHILEGIEKSK